MMGRYPRLNLGAKRGEAERRQVVVTQTSDSGIHDLANLCPLELGGESHTGFVTRGC